mmetsp:Transcript_8720/g.11394  ORF Transcript_8720/g.11394 Transcript_8720/m.11394 type:complete len:101 (-) Transcript_8720:654-956(-)
MHVRFLWNNKDANANGYRVTQQTAYGNVECYKALHVVLCYDSACPRAKMVHVFNQSTTLVFVIDSMPSPGFGVAVPSPIFSWLFFHYRLNSWIGTCSGKI